MSQIAATPVNGERTSIHDMLKDTPLNDNKTQNPPSSSNSTTYSRSVPTSLSTCGSPAILTPPQTDDSSLLKSSRIENIKNWSISTYKCTKQIMFEKLGKSSRTVDAELESRIDQLKETQKKYMSILRLTRILTSHFYQVVQTQHALGEAFSDLAQKSPELQEEFLYNSETQRNLTKNGETLLGALNFFISSVSTLCNKTIEDTLQSIRQYEAARIEYDAYRTDLESLSTKPDGTIGLEDAQQGYEVHREQFMKLRAEVTIKMKFLDENRIKVMHKQLLLFHNAVSAYFSGNQQALEATLKQFNIKVKTPSSTFPSWLEQ
nr:arfaptin-2 [Leptinotarsa decemlineata]